jgi:hypothetical protein
MLGHLIVSQHFMEPKVSICNFLHSPVTSSLHPLIYLLKFKGIVSCLEIKKVKHCHGVGNTDGFPSSLLSAEFLVSNPFFKFNLAYKKKIVLK